MQLKTVCFRKGEGWSEELPEWDSNSTMILAFGSPRMRHETKWLNDLNKKFPKSRIAGCSTAGEIFDRQIEDDSVVVAIARFASSGVEFASAPISAIADSKSCGEELARRIKKENLKGVFVISEGLKVNGSALIQGIASGLPEAVLVTGGLAGDGPDFKETWVLDGGEIRTGVVTAISFYGEKIKLGHGSRGGWDLFGPERIITRSKENVLYELDNRPALDLYKQYLGHRAKELPASGLLFPLQISKKGSGVSLVRTILAVDEAANALIFAGNVPEDWSAQFMRANFDRLIEGASNAAAETVAAEVESPCLAIAISCVGRRLVMHERAVEEVEATLDRLPTGTRQIGFYSYGEISPAQKLLTCELHNQTMTLTTIGEAA